MLDRFRAGDEISSAARARRVDQGHAEAIMQDLTREATTARVDELIRMWGSRRKLGTRGFGSDLLAALGPTAHYLPYLLATIFYSVGVYGKVTQSKGQKSEEDVSKKVGLWVDESIDRLLQFAPPSNVNAAKCRSDLTAVADELMRSLSKDEITKTAEVLSNKLFNILQQHDPTAGDKARSLVDYIVRAELRRLLPQA
jgi:hypothetical protein